jgi:uncharacterized Fe-S center protein
MTSTVYFSNMRASHKDNLFNKLSRHLAACDIDKRITAHDLVAVKIHFGERGNHTFIRPIFIRRVVDELIKLGANPFLTDSSTLYPGERKQAVSALKCAIENGFDYAVAGAPLIMCDGLRGQSEVKVEIPGHLLKQVSIGREIFEADAIIAVSHFKCHELTGFGGTLKNLGMGCSSRAGKLVQHSTVAPVVASKFCNACGICLKSCAHDAISIIESKAVINPVSCVGCGRCITTCPSKSINVQWNESSDLVMMKMSEHALGAVQGKTHKNIYVNFITQVSPACDCYGHADAPIVNDIGFCSSSDPVALDLACAELVNGATGNQNTALKSGHEPGGDKFRGVHPDINWETQLIHAEEIGLGSRKYSLCEI